MSPLFGHRKVAPVVEPVPSSRWSPLPFPGCRNVGGKVLVSQTELTVAMLRFGVDGTIHEHEVDHEIEVICLEGAGFTSVDGEVAAIAAGEKVTWPAGHPHRLWTEGSQMETLMVEHPRPYRA